MERNGTPQRPSKMRRMSYGQGGQGQAPWDPWKPGSQQQSQWGGQQTGASPDWAALAEASETRNRRRRLLFIVGGAVATVAVDGAVNAALLVVQMLAITDPALADALTADREARAAVQ